MHTQVVKHLKPSSLPLIPITWQNWKQHKRSKQEGAIRWVKYLSTKIKSLALQQLVNSLFVTWLHHKHQLMAWTMKTPTLSLAGDTGIFKSEQQPHFNHYISYEIMKMYTKPWEDRYQYCPTISILFTLLNC